MSVVVPTFREAENVPELARRVEAALGPSGEPFELILVDDDSRDGTDAAVRSLGKPWLRLHVRTGERGLSSAVIGGCRLARYDRLVVMDADLSHPPEAIPAMLARLDAGAGMALGSRYVPGGSTDKGWSLFRRVNSLVATWMARPLVTVADPMSGFFALRRADFASMPTLNPVGYKIGLEFMVKGGFRRIDEVPIHFADRTRGESKLGLKEQWRYVRHLGRLAGWKWGMGRKGAQTLKDDKPRTGA